MRGQVQTSQGHSPPSPAGEGQRLKCISALSLSQSHPFQEMPQPKAIKLSRPYVSSPSCSAPTAGSA